MEENNLMNSKKRIIQILLFVWFAGVIILTTYGIVNAPMICWDGAETDPVTGETRPIGGCETDYILGLYGVIIPTIMWTGLFFIIITAIVLKKMNE